MTEANSINKNNQVEVGQILYHWRYGAMKIKEISGEFIILEVCDFEGLREDKVSKDPWGKHLVENFKKFPNTAIEKWLFQVPEKVGTSKPAYGNRSFFSDEAFLRKLNTTFDKELVMECKNNYAKYLSKIKEEKINSEQENIGENNSAISEKEIHELVKLKEEYILNKKEKEEELEYTSTKGNGHKEQLVNLENNINRCKKKISEKEKRIATKENELDKIENESSSGYNKNQGLVIDIEGEIRRLEESIDELKSEINEAARSMETINKNQVKVENKRNILNKEIEEIDNKILNLENHINALV